MSFESFIEETMDEAMEPYTGSDEYKIGRSDINKKITKFCDSLTSETQRAEFLQLIDLINTADADFSVNAYINGFKTGRAFEGHDLER